MASAGWRRTGTPASSSTAAPPTWSKWPCVPDRVPEVDLGGVPTDQRTAEKVGLDALRRQPDTGFAIHDAPSPVEALLAKQSELRSLLRQRPPDAGPALRQAEFALSSAEKELAGAHYRLQHAEERLERYGRLSQLRRHGRTEKAGTLDQIERFTDDVQTAEAKIARCRNNIEDLRSQRDNRSAWDAEHDWPAERLRGVDSHLAYLARQGQEPELARRTHLLDRNPGLDHGRGYQIDGVEIRPPARGPDLGMDLGL